jgi:hypothetical protein
VSFLELVGAFTASTGADAVVITIAELEVGMGMIEVEVVVAVVVTCSAGGVFARAGVESWDGVADWEGEEDSIELGKGDAEDAWAGTVDEVATAGGAAPGARASVLIVSSLGPWVPVDDEETLILRTFLMNRSHTPGWLPGLRWCMCKPIEAGGNHSRNSQSAANLDLVDIKV